MDFEYEKELGEHGFLSIAGIDEAGRGPLAGPVYAASCILDENFPVEILDDSKAIKEPQRKEIFDIIVNKAVCFSFSSVSAKYIDRYGIAPAVHKAMRDSMKKLSISPDFLLIDGYNVNIPGIPQEAVINGDATYASIAGASIIAKVMRDAEMYRWDKKYPEYGFGKHKGYGTKAHIEAIQKYGPCPIHRMTFAKVK